jgi:hypothetical protein
VLRRFGESLVQSIGGGLLLLVAVLPSLLHQRLVTRHAKDALCCTSIAKILDLALAVPAAEAAGTKGLIARQNGQIFDLVPTGAAAVGAIVADEGSIAKKEQVGVRVEKGAARVAAEAVNVPSITS